ncbi:DUF2218 domain-containing protein [Jannaschia sp. 2305UL9-9]|uniref:DUF2218 domain-containing protein n=1 Tax=Jannaschia sp. 2305UL9-9 TaxID=3121638 RepID=UPI003526CD47
MQPPLSDLGRFETANASRYLQQLCKHFAHKVEVRHDETSGEAALPTGPATLRAEPGALIVTVTADDADGLARARHIVDDHLKRFAFREAFETMSWTSGAT